VYLGGDYLFERPIQKKEAMVDKVNILDYY
jgi:hypothetical protein